MPRKSVEISESYTALASKHEPTHLPEGERRRATILFSDLSGYTEMNERLDPEEVEKIMSQIKKEAVRIVETHRGVVNQFVGDEVLALFGIPVAHEDDPLRAVKAALELHEMIRQMSPKVEAILGKPLTMHTGINTGLIVTNPSDDRDGLYGITGDTVNTGARLKLQAESDDILVSPETQRLIAPYFETNALDAIRMKGKTKAMIPYRVIGESKVHSRFEAAEQKGFKTYTGRDQELTALHGCLEKAIRGEGQFVTVVGEAGVGKSRLQYEFRRSLDSEKATVLQGRCQSYGSDTP
jgi:class 3 adenylate cyclase